MRCPHCAGTGQIALDVSECRSCGAEIVWTETLAGRNMPVDVLPGERGTVQLSPRPAASPLARVLSGDALAQARISGEGELYVSLLLLPAGEAVAQEGIVSRRPRARARRPNGAHPYARGYTRREAQEGALGLPAFSEEGRSLWALAMAGDPGEERTMAALLFVLPQLAELATQGLVTVAEEVGEERAVEAWRLRELAPDIETLRRAVWLLSERCRNLAEAAGCDTTGWADV